MDDIASVVEPMRSLDWEDVDAVEAVGRKVFETVDADRSILRSALENVADRPDLLTLCEHPDVEVTVGQGQQFDKIVIYSDSESGVRVRLHVFWDGSYDLPHNHRFSFTSMILKGRLRHSLFGEAGPDDAMLRSPLKPLLVREEHPGSIYALHHSMLHSTVAEPQSVTLAFRGPASRERSFIVDPATGRRIWFLGAAKEAADEAERKRMTPSMLHDLSAKFGKWGLF